jgi:hypothetical protein
MSVATAGLTCRDKMSATNPYFSGVNIFKPYTVVEATPERLHLQKARTAGFFCIFSSEFTHSFY